ncbi:hypothetical protein [Allobranchiibius sp. CTAmp26]|uniref:hypothetical protein n=1 Tax=Allobranchiibius sp. CTAmp26 TaxID=2815214 RepID=UPI001AA13E9A|nr:hypothetical protein [Allobranchiibius sp. CTAmp26]MBO1755628.1 hypothetical protein [Allobranchiibius sp. CTAmp26]
MHHANVFYGHAAILARYCGLSTPPYIWGYLQHGWNTHDGFAVGHEFVPGYPKLVWSHSVARRGRSLGVRDYVVIGSPWAYLLKLHDLQGTVLPDARGTIVYPFHGWEEQDVVGDHAAYAAEIRRVEGDVPLTACLYWSDHEKPAVRRVYEEAGFRVITHGRRGHMYVGGDADFLDRQLLELRNHRRAVSNRMGSALLYASSLGLSTGVYGDPMVLAGDHAVLGGVERQRRLFPTLHQVQVPEHAAREVACAELGLDLTLPPALLAHALSWDKFA